MPPSAASKRPVAVAKTGDQVLSNERTVSYWAVAETRA